MNNLSITRKILLLLSVTIVGSIATNYWMLKQSESALYEEREVQLRSQVDLALSVMNYYQQQEATLGRETAQEAARQAIKALRYDGKNYFWIMTPENQIVMHPFRPDMDGTDQGMYQDKVGNYLFDQMSRLVKQQKEGFVDYYWTRPGGDTPVAKRSFVKQMNDWGWIVGTGVYIDDIEAVVFEQLSDSAILLLVILLLLGGIFYWFNHTLQPRISAILQQLQQIAEGNLSKAHIDNSKDEFGVIAQAVETMRLSQRTLLEQVDLSADSLRQTAHNLASMTEQSRANSQSQLEELEQVASAMHQSSAANQEVMANAYQLSDVGQNTEKEASTGAAALSKAINSVEESATQVADASSAVAELRQDVEGIGEIVSVINGISEQTNLLALNAAIEAARAGEQGRGFSVVADEVRNLAKRTQDSTSEIQSMIQRLQTKADNVSMAIDDSQQESSQSVKTARGAGERLSEITSLMNQLNNMSAQIAASTQEQATVAEDLTRNLVLIRDKSQGAHQAAESIGHEATSLAQLSQQLNNEMQRYRL